MISPAKKFILIVDDDADIRQIISMILNDEGYQTHELDNGRDVNRELVKCRPDLILLDVQLGDMDGRDICRELKSAPATETIPIIIVSATNGRYSKDNKDCHPDDYLDKPFDIGEL